MAERVEVYLFANCDSMEGIEAEKMLKDAGIVFTLIPVEGMAPMVTWGARKFGGNASGYIKHFVEAFLEEKKELHKSNATPKEKKAKRKVSEEEKKVVYRVEKFVPSECPSCTTKFNMEGKEYIIMDPPKEGFTRSYDILLCKWCGNKTARVMYEAREYILLDAAERKVQDEGFVNLHKIPRDYPRNCHITYSRGAISTQLELTDEERRGLTIPEGALGPVKP